MGEMCRRQIVGHPEGSPHEREVAILGFARHGPGSRVMVLPGRLLFTAVPRGSNRDQRK